MMDNAPRMDLIQIAIVEDNDTIREGLKELINSSEGFSCVGAYPSAEQALADIQEQSPDVVLMDINLPGMSGIECTRQLKSMMKSVQVMMLTVYENDEHIFPPLKAGATGYMVKRTKPEKLLPTIRDLRDGGSRSRRPIRTWCGGGLWARPCGWGGGGSRRRPGAGWGCRIGGRR